MKSNSAVTKAGENLLFSWNDVWVLSWVTHIEITWNSQSDAALQIVKSRRYK